MNNRMKSYPAFTLAVLMTFFLNGYAQSDRLTLPDAIKAAKNNRHLLGSLEMETRISQLKTTELNARYLPKISLDYNYQYHPIIASGIIPLGELNPNVPTGAGKALKMGTSYTQNAGLTVQQPLLDISVSKLVRESKLQEKLARLNEKDAELELTYEVAKAYLNVLASAEQVRIAVNDTVRTALSLKMVREKFLNQRVLKAEVNETLVTHYDNVQQYHNARNAELVSRQYLLYVTGNDLSGAPLLVLEDYNLSQDISDMDETRLTALPKIEILKIKNEVLNNKEKLERLKYSPLINLNAYLGGDQFSDRLNPFKQNSWYGNSYFGVSLKLPVLFGEQTAKRLSQLKYQQRQNEYQMIEEINRLKHDIQSTAAKFINILQQLNTLTGNINLSSETVAIYQERFKESQLSLNELNDREVRLQHLKLQYEKLKKELIIAWLDWKKANGTIEFIK